MSLEEVSNLDFELRLALHAKWGTIKLTFFAIFLEKHVLYIVCKRLQTKAYYIPLEIIFCHEYELEIITSK